MGDRSEGVGSFENEIVAEGSIESDSLVVSLKLEEMLSETDCVEEGDIRALVAVPEVLRDCVDD